MFHARAMMEYGTQIVGGDTTKLQTALKLVNQEMEELKEEIRELKKQIRI